MRALLLLSLIACADPPADSKTPDGDTAGSAPGEGTLALSFRIDTDYQTNMEEPAVGTFYGSYWLADEVSGIGPDEGAVDLGSIEVAVDLTAANPTAVLLVSPPLPATEVVILGFLDSDGNSTADARRPDAKDPVTLPSDNDFDVVGGEETTAEVFFGLLNPTS